MVPAEGHPDEPFGYDVGSFEQGSPLRRWALARYLVGRAIGESVSRNLLILAVGLLIMAGVVEWFGSTFWAVLIAVAALAVLAMRAVLRAVLGRLTAAKQVAPVEARLNALVDSTRAAVFAELRRIGLPGRSWTLPLLAMRFLGRRRRATTLARLRTFELDRVVPPSRVDELHLIIRDTLGR